MLDLKTTVLRMVKGRRLSLALGLVCGLGATSAGAASSFHWGNVAIGGGGFVSAIVPSNLEKNLFYARTDVGGAYRWNESGKKWVALTDWIGADELGLWGIEALAVDPKTPGKVYMMAGTVYWNMINGKGRTAFLRSSDYGATWEKIFVWDTVTQDFNANGNGMGRGNGERLAIDPNDPDVMFYGSRDKGLWKSTDNGSTWKHVDGFTKAAGYDTTWNGCGFSFVQFAPGSSTTMYAGFLREGDNVFKSTDGGATWTALPIPSKLYTTAGGSKVRLMPQRLAVPSGNSIFVTFADGAGPHTMAWSEGWGMIADGFGRGAILKYNFDSASWSDASPENFIDDGAKAAGTYDDMDVAGGTYQYLAPYGGIYAQPGDSLKMVASNMGYRGPQFWKLDSTGKKWKDQWGSNIYYTQDGGKSWIKSFQYYWMDGGIYPKTEEMNANGIGWMFNSTIHWSGSVVMDPFNPKRVFVTSGNGVYMTDDITDYTYTPAVNSWDSPTLDQRQVWKVASHGIEEVVPMEVVSIPGGPLISTIGDYDGFRHDDVTAYPPRRLQTLVSGTAMSLGTTRAIAWAPKARKLVKVADKRAVNPDQYSTVGISPLQFSVDSGSTWSVATYETLDTTLTGGRCVAISTDGAVTLWTPAYQSGKDGDYVVHRYATSAWTTVSGIDGAYVVGDPEDANVFYAYKKSEGAFYKSTDKGVTFAKVSAPGVSNYQKFRLAPDRNGDIWLPVSVAGQGGLMHSIDGGATWATLPGLSECQAVGFGKAATGATYPSLFAYGTVAGVLGVFQSDDQGATWTRVNDDMHRYGGLANGEFVVGDMNTYGVVYMSTAGRGIAARLPGGDSTPSVGISKAVTKALGLARLRGDLLSVEVGDQPVTVQVYGMDGRLLSRRVMSTSGTLQVSSLMANQGMYVLKVDAGKSSLMTRRITRLH